MNEENENEIDTQEEEEIYDIYSLIIKTFQMNRVQKSVGLNAIFMVILSEIESSERKKSLYRDFARVFIEKMNECEDET